MKFHRSVKADFNRVELGKGLRALFTRQRDKCESGEVDELLFLLNEQVVDLDVPELRLRELVGQRADKLERLGPRGVMALGQEIYFNVPDGGQPDQKARTVLSCLIAITIEADAAVFVKPARATRPQHVAVRLATLPITTLSFLQSMQDAGMLTPRLINQTVWDQASQESA